jgi:hypothetical protein
MDPTSVSAKASAAAQPSLSRPVVIGWKEHADFPEWGVRRVKVKIDTGARTSALGVSSYQLHHEKAGMVAEVQLALKRKFPNRIKVVRVPVLSLVMVRNTGGSLEQRPLVETTLRMGPITKRVQFTLADRGRMRFPMILGRKALEGDFTVDVARKYLLG